MQLRRLPWGWSLLIIIHLIGLTLYLDFDQVFNNPPVSDSDYGLHWAEVWSVSHFLEDGRLWGYDPFFMAGHPEGTIFDIDNKFIEVASWLVSKSGVSLPLSYNLVLLSLAFLSPLVVYPAVRWLNLGRRDAFVAQLITLALWYLDPTLRWNWLGGTLAFGCTVFLSLLLLAAAVRLAENRMTKASWLVWWVFGPLLFWVHILAFILLCLPLTWLVLRNWRSFNRQQWLAFLLWPVVVLLVSLPWLATAARFAWAKVPSDQFLQGGLPALASDLLGRGYVDGASTFKRLGVRWLTLIIGGLGFWRLARRQKGMESVALGAWVGFLLAYGAVYLPGGGDLQPYRYIDQAMIWSTVGLGGGLRFIWHKLAKPEDSDRWRLLRQGVFLLAVVLILLWVKEAVALYRPPQVGGNRFNVWEGPSDEAKAICDYLQTVGAVNGRLLTDDSRVGALLPWLCGVEVVGGPFSFTWTEYGYTNANIWTFLETPYSEYDAERWRQALQTYNVEWLIVNSNWGVPQWFTMADWLAEHSEETGEPGPRFGDYQLYKVTSDETADNQMTITADHGFLHIQNAVSGQAVRLPYHWIPDLKAQPPGSAVIENEIVGDDPIPFIVVIPAQETFLICSPTGCPER